VFNVESALCLSIAVINKPSRDGALAIVNVIFNLLKRVNSAIDRI